MNLTEMRARVREDLQDTDALNYRWANDEVDGAIERVVREFSLAYPLQQQDDIATPEGSNELDISSLTQRLKVYSVEFPMGQHPPYYQKFTQYMAALYMEDVGNGDDARIRWGKQHTLLGDTAWTASHVYALGDIVIPTTNNGFWYECTTAGTSGTAEPTWPITEGLTVTDNTVVWTCRSSSIPEEHEEIIVLGATGYLATSASVYTVDKATIAGRYATADFLKWGQQRLDRYEKKLKAISSRVITRELYSEE